MSSGPGGLTPAVVVVDSRNLWGATRQHFGAGVRLTVPGLGRALAAYGFEVVHTYVGLATELGTKRPSARLRAALDVNAGYKAALELPGDATVLVGRLAERDGEIEEKLVDVQCAIQIARSAHEIASGKTRARAIVVISEDMDLIPAYRFAQDLDVPVFAGACATVDTRADSSWLLIVENGLRLMTQRPMGRLAGSDLRAEVAKWLTAQTPREMAFTVVVNETSRGRVRLRHNSGAIGYWYSPPAGVALLRGARHLLKVTGLDDCESEREFPLLRLSTDTPPWPPARMERGSVVSWTTPTRVEVALESGTTRRFGAAAGTYLPGDSVLVHEDHSRAQVARRLVGRLAPPRSTPGWPDPVLPRLARCETASTSPGARVLARLLDDQTIVTVQPPGTDTARVGHHYAVIPIGHLAQQDGSMVPLTVAVSSELGPRE